MRDNEHLDFLVRRNNLSEARWAPAQTVPDQALAEDEVLLRVDRYSLTSNNITYGLIGELMHYWEFFPAPEGWGRIPVWGFADVVASRATAVREGERVFGYLPMSSFLRVRAADATDHGFLDASAHRSALPAVYQRYLRTRPDSAAVENKRALLQPLAGTGFLLASWMHAQQDFGARHVLVASASSKTALAAAFHLSARSDRDYQVVGLTSQAHRTFCERTGYYDRVVTYADIAGLPGDESAVLIDMAGNREIVRSVHTHFAGTLRYSCFVGMTHGAFGAPAGAQAELPGPAPQLFFAPTQIEQGNKQFGPAVFMQRVRDAEQTFFASTDSWLEIVERSGPAAIEASYQEVREGRVPPQQGLVLTP